MSDAKLSTRHTVARSRRIAQRLFEERMLVITVDDSRLHRLNEVGTFIWALLDTPKSIDEICARVAGNFDECEYADIAGDTLRFVDMLVNKGLATVTAPRGERE